MHRQEKILQRVGIDLPRASLASWVIKVSKLVKPIVNQLKQDLIKSDYLQCDETPVQVLNEPGKSPQSKSYMWVVVRAGPKSNIVFYQYSPSRSGTVPKNLLSGFKGCLQTDGYEGYNQITSRHDIYGMACLAHIRRKFVDAVKA